MIHVDQGHKRGLLSGRSRIAASTTLQSARRGGNAPYSGASVARGRMAHGAATRSDVERVRRDLGEADERSVEAEEIAVTRHRQKVAARVAEHEQDARIPRASH